MAQDATGPLTTNFELPTFDVDNDSPSGFGGNAIVQAIDAALATRAPTPPTTGVGEAVGFDGDDFQVVPITGTPLALAIALS